MAKIKSKYQGKNGGFYIVNPAGAIHTVTREHATQRLRIAGWRLAEDHEIETYKEVRVQRHNKPICEPWSPEPEILEDIPEAEIGTVEATESATELALEHGVDLRSVTGSGAGGRILQRDVEALINERSTESA